MTNEKQQTLAELITEVEAYFKTLSYSSNRMRIFRIGWHALDEYMKMHSIDFYNPIAGEAFIESILGTGSYAELNRLEKDIIRCTNVLTEYQTTGTVKFRSVSKTYEFKGEIGKLILGFLSYRKSKGLSKDTLDSNRLYLHRFLEYLDAKDVKMVSSIDKRHILDFINSLASLKDIKTLRMRQVFS